MSPRWMNALSWLKDDQSHVPTARDVVRLKAYFKAHPEQLKERDGYGYLPLHHAAISQSGEHAVDVIQALLTADPAAARYKSDLGRLPLYFAAGCQKGEHGVAVVTALLAAYPEAAQQKTLYGMLPFHHAQLNRDLPASCVSLLRKASKQWPPAPGAHTAHLSLTGASYPASHQF